MHGVPRFEPCARAAALPRLRSARSRSFAAQELAEWYMAEVAKEYGAAAPEDLTGAVGDPGAGIGGKASSSCPCELSSCPSLTIH